MTKRKSTNETTKMTQTALWLPIGMHEKLKKAGGARKLGDEIRRRLKNSFDAEKLPRDPVTASCSTRSNKSKEYLDELSHGTSNRFIYDVFKEAINRLLSNYQPDAQPGAVTKLQAKYGSGVKAETIGQILADVAFKTSKASRPIDDLPKG